MTVPALLFLEHRGALTFQGRATVQVLNGNWIATPGVHDWTPRAITGQMRQCAKGDRGQQNCDDGNWATLPALLTFSGKKGQQDEKSDDDHRTDEQRGRFHLRGQEG